MAEFNWDTMPAEFRRKLLDIASMDVSLEQSRWVSMSIHEKKVLNEAMLNLSRGLSALKGME